MLSQVVLFSLLQTCCSANVRQSSTSQTSTVSKPWATLQYEDDEVECRRSGQLIHRVSLNRSVNKDSTPMAKRGDWRPERGQTFSRVPLATWPCPTWGRHESINRNVAVFGLPVLPVGLKPWCPGNSGLPLAERLCAPPGDSIGLGYQDNFKPGRLLMGWCWGRLEEVTNFCTVIDYRLFKGESNNALTIKYADYFNR